MNFSICLKKYWALIVEAIYTKKKYTKIINKIIKYKVV